MSGDVGLMFICLCDTCFKEFKSPKLLHICDDCRSKLYIKNYKYKAGLCFNCTNYWTCGKKDSIEVREFMLKYEFKNKKYGKNTYEILVVYDCEKFSTEKIKRTKSIERFVDNHEFV